MRLLGSTLLSLFGYYGLGKLPAITAHHGMELSSKFQSRNRRHYEGDFAVNGGYVQSGNGSERTNPVLHPKRPKVTLLKKLFLNASIISALDSLSRDSKAINKQVIGW